MLDCMINGDCGSTYIHVCLQIYMISVFFGFSNFHISRYPELQEIWKSEIIYVCRQTYMYIHVDACIYVICI